MRSPTCLLESRVYSSKNLRSTVQKDFCNTICHERSLARATQVGFLLWAFIVRWCFGQPFGVMSVTRKTEITMRAAILASGMILGLVSASVAMPMATLPDLPKPVQVHGCHHHYAQDISGWHRHDKGCRTLRGVVGRKSRNPAKS
jgi:hypothetical protein